MCVLAVIDPPNRYAHQCHSTHHKVLVVFRLVAKLIYQVKRGFRVLLSVADDGGHCHGGIQVENKASDCGERCPLCDVVAV